MSYVQAFSKDGPRDFEHFHLKTSCSSWKPPPAVIRCAGRFAVAPFGARAFISNFGRANL